MHSQKLKLKRWFHRPFHLIPCSLRDLSQSDFYSFISKQCYRLIKSTFKRVHYNLPRNLTGYRGPTQWSALSNWNVKGKWQRKIFNSSGIYCGEMRKQSKSLTHNHLTQRGPTELMMLDIFCCLSHSTSPISATLPCDSETRPDKWKDRMHSERKPSTHGNTGNESAQTASTHHQVRPETFLPEKGTSKKPFFQRICKIHCKQKEKSNSRKTPPNTSFLCCPLSSR